MNHLFKKLVVILLFIKGFIAHSQTLTISSNGDVGPTSGPNWSINNGQLYYTANANVQASVITSALANGSLTIQAATNVVSVIVDQDIITTTNNSGITIGNINSNGIVTFNRTIDIYGAITVYADKINMGANLITTGNSAQLLTRVASGHISLFAKNGFETLANSNCERGKIHPIAGGNLHISADADNNNKGILNIDWLTLDESNADILGVDFEFGWNAGEEDNLNSNYKLFHYGTRWDLKTGTTSVIGTTLSYTGYTVSLSPFALGSDESPLPVTLLTFEAEKSGADALHTRTTANETYNRGFEVIKSGDGMNWNPIGFVTGAGNSVETLVYQFVDYNFNTLAYYKLKQVDFDGNFSYSPIRMLHVPAAANTQVLDYPNPSQGSLNLQATEHSRYELYDILGKQIRESKVS